MASQDEVAPNSQETREPLTDELLERLLASASPEAYLTQAPLDDRSLSDYLYHLLDVHGLTRAQVVRDSEVTATFVYQIFSGERGANKDTVVRLALGMGCTLRETQRLLHLAEAPELWCKNRRDASIIFCIDHGYDLIQTDEELFRHGEPTLVPQEG